MSEGPKSGEYRLCERCACVNCGGPIPRRDGAGRHRRYCAPRCSQLAAHARARLRRRAFPLAQEVRRLRRLVSGVGDLARQVAFGNGESLALRLRNRERELAEVREQQKVLSIGARGRSPRPAPGRGRVRLAPVADSDTPAVHAGPSPAHARQRRRS